MRQFSGMTALVTGASSGLGADFARQLAAAGCRRVILVARRRERLEAVAESVGSEFPDCSVSPLEKDIGDVAGADALYTEIADAGWEVDILVNNAGFGLHGGFLELPWERELAMLRLDVLVPVRLTRLFADAMRRRGRGWILQIASLAAYQPMPTYASYGAAKRFILDYGEAVARELAGTGVTCTVLSPGVTRTEFLEVAGQNPSLYQRLVMMESGRVVRVGLKALARGPRSVVPGASNKLMAASNRLMPRRLSTFVAENLMKI